MEKRNLLQSLIGTFLGGALLFSCASEEVSRGIDNTRNEFLTISSEQKVCFDIEYKVPEGYRVVFDVYAENPYQITAEGASMKEVNPIISGMTDEHGRYQVSRVVSAGVEEVFVVSRSMGTPMMLYGVVESGNVKPVEMDLSAMVDTQAEVDSRAAAFSPYYLGTWNFWGRPNYIDASKTCEISKDELRTISKALPEWKSVNKDYVEADFIYVKKEAEVWVSLLSAKSLFNNALGYYCYEEGMTKNDVKEIIAIPRTDISWFEKKSLKSGEYVKLKYLNPQTNQFEDKFPAGSRIGWVLHRSGFRCLNSQVNNGTYQFYSVSEWNPENTKKEHTAIFSTKEGNVILGFEDVYNESLFADNDCNDVIFHVTSSPEDAISTSIEIPDASKDVIEEEVDVVQALSMIVDIPATDELGNDLVVASKSILEVEDGSVIGVKDVLFIAKSEAMNKLITQTYTVSDWERKVVVRTTVKFARSSEEDEKKGRTVVRTTVKNTTWEVDEANSRTVMNYTGDISDLILSTVEEYRQQLADGKCIRLEIIMQFEGVGYEQFVENIDVPPYSPFIENVAK
ncbi:MAG: DUF4114 domain-containing protein [Bacteroidaceae bacterium]|nr:DUF4114 domain-containing protein [Bacteroidaceae bacterium]